ncbi:opioid growth factor receptor-like protein 1 [Seriola lalandi dorsalis]|uniref:Opioid growth factor receptor n=1 Tax=Seriola lalandi dorsalis TaxID=1841481 RepID=A0A3B4XDK8_SERLL|nr:opioid growth factor receptor-like protein 1 [Seriola lalandi dorsalis]XP_056241800.1 opioid growth factor receptor [Seriola aureovittata]
MEDDCVCEYDSTWDTESDGDDPAGESQTRRSSQDKNKSGWTLWHPTPRNMRAAKDMQNYRRGYPNLTDDECSEDKMNNLQFYLNKFPSAPDDVFIESFLKEWKNDYKRLERVHSYIQWLFPLREPGVNYMASELTKKEIEAFKKNEDAKRRLVESYELMLGFYGIRLVNKETGEVKRAENWKERFGNLERNMHNNLRITRILKSLGELGFERYQAPLVRFFLEETLVKKTLSSVKRSVLDYFLFAVLDKQKRQELVRFAYLHFEPKDKFVWCPRKIQKQFRKAEKRSDAIGNGDGKDEVYSRGKSKDGEAVVQQKEDGLDNVTKTQKGTDKTANKDKNKLSEASPEPKQEAETVGNGKTEAEPNKEILGNGNDSTDDVDEMDQSPSPDTVVAKTEPSEDSDHKLTNNSKDTIQEPDNSMQTDGDIDTEKPPKKKREDNKVLPSNGSIWDSASGQLEEKAGAHKATGQMSPSAQTPHKTSKHSPSLSSGREEKIPRTDFNQVLDKKEGDMSQENVSATNGSLMSTDKPVDEQRNGKELEDMDMASNPSSSDQNVGNS